MEEPPPAPLPLTAAELDDITDQPPFYNPPAFDYQPEHGSHGVPPIDLRMNTVSATSIAGAFPSSLNPFNNNNGNDYTTIELHNIIRLATVVWGVNCKPAISSLIGDALRCSLDGTINSLIADRIDATEANPQRRTARLRATAVDHCDARRDHHPGTSLQPTGLQLPAQARQLRPTSHEPAQTHGQCHHPRGRLSRHPRRFRPQLR